MGPKLFTVRLVVFEYTGEGNNVEPVTINEWKVSLFDVYQLFMSYMMQYPNAESSSENRIDDIHWIWEGKDYSLFIAEG